MNTAAMKGMRAAIFLLTLFLIGCGKGFKEYDLDQTSFGADTMKLIEDASGIKIPGGAKGLRFHYIPPIDPIYFAKIEIPDADRKTLEAQIERFKDGKEFPDNFANDRCDWWPSSFTNAVISRKAVLDYYYLELYLMKEDGRLILYLKYGARG